MKRLLGWPVELQTPLSAAPACRLEIKDHQRVLHDGKMTLVAFNTAP